MLYNIKNIFAYLLVYTWYNLPNESNKHHINRIEKYGSILQFTCRRSAS